MKKAQSRKTWQKKHISRRILAVLPHLIYFVSVLDLLWFIVTIWVLVDDYDEVQQGMNCQIRFEGIIIFQGLYKLLLFLFMIYKIEVMLGNSAHRYPRKVYLLLKIFTALYILISYGSLFIFPSFVEYQQFPSAIGGFDCYLEIPAPSFVEYQQFPSAIGGFDCYLEIPASLLWLGGAVDAILCIVCVTMFTFKLRKVVNQTKSAKDGELSRQSKALQSVVFKNAVLSFIALSSTWIFYYIGFQGTHVFGWFASLDFAINNLCIFLMFSHNQALFKKLCCGCFIRCGLECAKRNTLQLSLSAAASSSQDQVPIDQVQMTNTVQ
eukprot:CAMPEP_0197081290 /NCGR_PEP_ID=MMETSP1384-20130603/214563_1 /TAXON_ID=29189 /ORGANISM="Ammonia sp." /LENGTH=322 /DNA_ID=CAMNT_0042520185 /DNA_START=21 /DNA_END=988 /DNA_ORIENTATION=-